MATRSTWLDRFARFGLACRGVVYLVVGLLALNLARGRKDQADQRGALENIAHQPFGHFLVLVIAIGFGCLTLWQATLVVQPRRREGVRHRAAAAWKALVYGGLSLSALGVFRSRRARPGGDQEAVDITGRVMRHSSGRLLVGAVGVVVCVVGLALIRKGLRREFDTEVHITDVPFKVRRTFETIGSIGMMARGVVVAFIGYFVLQAAITFNPAHAKGVDGVLVTVVHQRWGPWLLVVIAAGLGCFGLFSILEARYARL